jgi:hypothetical protein
MIIQSKMNKPEMEYIPYLQIVKCLMYFMINTYPNISLVVEYMTNLSMFHWGVVKQFFYYLHGIKDHGFKL